MAALSQKDLAMLSAVAAAVKLGAQRTKT